MTNNSYSTAIEVGQSPQDVFIRLQDVSKWWGGEDLDGESADLNDEFTITHPGAHYSKQKLVEVVANKKMVWLVTESTLYWLEKDKHEWANTKMIFEITNKGGKTVLHFTHEGLIPERKCYAKCEQGWNMVIKDWLFNFITAGIGHFRESKRKQQSYTVTFETVLSPTTFSHILAKFQNGRQRLQRRPLPDGKRNLKDRVQN